MEECCNVLLHTRFSLPLDGKVNSCENLTLVYMHTQCQMIKCRDNVNRKYINILTINSTILNSLQSNKFIELYFFIVLPLCKFMLIFFQSYYGRLQSYVR